MKKKNKKFQKLGKAGADKRWAKKHEVVVELSKYVNKNDLNWITTWKIEQLVKLLEVYQNGRTN